VFLGSRSSLFSFNSAEFCYQLDFRISKNVLAIYVNSFSSILSAILYCVYMAFYITRDFLKLFTKLNIRVEFLFVT